MALNAELARAPLLRFHYVVVTICMLVLVADGIDLQLAGLVAPVIISEWGIDRGDFGWAMSAALVGMALGAWAGGYLGDRFGRKNALIWAVLLFGSVTLAASTAQSVSEMALLRMVGGLGFGAAFPNTMALASEWLPERWRPYAITLLSVGTPAGGSIASVAVPFLLESHGWRGSFVAFGSVTVLMAVPVALLLQDSPSSLLSRGRKAQALAAARRVIPHLDAAAVSGAAKPSADMGKAHQSGPGVLSAVNARFNIGVGMGFAAATLVAYAIISWGTTFLTAAGLTLEQALVVSFRVGIFSIIGALVAGHFSRQYGSRPVLVFAGVSSALLVILLFVLLELHLVPVEGSVWDLVQWSVVLLSGTASIAIATIYVVMAYGYQQSCRSSGIGLGMLLGRLGAIFISFVGGYLIDFGAGSMAPFLLTLLAGTVIMSVAAFVLDRHVMPAPLPQSALA